MSPSMPSEDVQLLVAGYVLGDLDPDEAAEFERRLQSDPAITAEVSLMQRALEFPFVDEVQPPAFLQAKILAAHAQQVATPVTPSVSLGSPGSVAPAPRRPFPWSWTLNAIAAGIILALGISNYQLSRQLQLATETNRELVTLVLQGTQGTPNATATVAVNPNSLAAKLTAKNLPPLPPGKVYALWTVLKPDAPFTTDSHGAILTQVFSVNSTGEVSQEMMVPAVFREQGLVKKVAVTVEDATAPQKHQGKPVLVAVL